MNITVCMSVCCAALAGFLWPRGIPAAARRLGALLSARGCRENVRAPYLDHSGVVVGNPGVDGDTEGLLESPSKATGRDLSVVLSDGGCEQPVLTPADGSRPSPGRTAACGPADRPVDERSGGALRPSNWSVNGSDAAAEAITPTGASPRSPTADPRNGKRGGFAGVVRKGGSPPARGAAARSRRLPPWGAALPAGVFIALLFGGLLGVAGGAATVVGIAVMLGRLESREQRDRRARMAADLPIAVDLLAACLRGGVSWGGAVESVAGAIGGPLGDELYGVAARVRLGADPTAAWLALAENPELAPLARTAARTMDSGAAPAPALARLAEDRRRAARAAASSRARAVGIRAVAPLGLCFLPAFVLLGVVPAVAGIARTLLPLF